MLNKFIRLAGAGLSIVTALAAASAAMAQQPTSIRIGWSISKTGPYAGGASITTLPAYLVWVKDVNAAGGIMLKSLGKKLPVEVDRVRRSQQLRRDDQGGRAPRHPGQGRFHPAALGHRLQPGGSAPIFEPLRLSAPRR